VPEARVLIIEACQPGGEEYQYIPVGASILRGGVFFPEYIQNEPRLKDIVAEARTKRNHLYLHTLVTEFREETREIRKGSGAELVMDARGWARELGKEVLFVDCFGGNEGRLAR